MSRLTLTRQQADYLQGLRAVAERSQHAFAAALNAVALGIGQDGVVNYDFGPEPWVEVMPPALDGLTLLKDADDAAGA